LQSINISNSKAYTQISLKNPFMAARHHNRVQSLSHHRRHRRRRRPR